MKTLIFLFLVVLALPGCSGRKAPEVYAEGLAAEQAGNPALAIERYEEVVRDFTAEAVAETAMYKIVMLRGNNLADKQGALAAQRRFLELFPHSGRVPTVMFMMAFMYNNELHELDSARKYYDLFLSKYPDHELAASARFEIETLGKAPDELIGGSAGEVPGAAQAKSGEAKSGQARPQ
ncbi:MAG TPA: tetratricopeptide repeat protein [Bacteroidota bacterium]|nr:tetratricopeptide repeat protein [Bacteroidota bacterium]